MKPYIIDEEDHKIKNMDIVLCTITNDPGEFQTKDWFVEIRKIKIKGDTLAYVSLAKFDCFDEHHARHLWEDMIRCNKIKI